MAQQNSEHVFCTEGKGLSPEPIAIIGMGCRFPGGVSSPSQFWDFLCQEKTGWEEFQPDRINLNGYYHPNANRPASLQTRGANLLQEDPRKFDYKFFGIQEVEARAMDPNQRKMLEVTYEAFESAGEALDNLFGTRTGVFVGNFNTDYHLNQMYDIDFALPYTATGGSASILSNRVSHVFNLRGPSVTVDTACSSSMYALHFAVSALRAGDCDAAIVGGSNLILSPEMQLLTRSLGALSATSVCHTFDASADGYGRGEGFGALYLKRHSDARNANHPIRALIRSTAVNSHGKTAGISHPGIEGQEALIRDAYKSANLSTKETGYFECHGTGTIVGDPVEVAAIGRVFAPERESNLLIGSVKTNLGHSESASGITGIIKCVLAIEKGLIPPTIGVKNLNPQIDFCATRTKVVTELTPWPEHTVRRASINSFGYGGANGHCILDHALTLFPTPIPTSPRIQHMPIGGISREDLQMFHSQHQGSRALPLPTHNIKGLTTINRNWFMLPFSGHDTCALQDNIRAIHASLPQYALSDIAYTLARRSKFRCKSFRLVDSNDCLGSFERTISVIQKSQNSQHIKFGFVFTAQGAQWQEMGLKLFAFPEFRCSLDQQTAVLKSLSFGPSWNLEDVLSGHLEVSIQDALISQTSCTALQIGLVDLLRSWNIGAHATAGHSSGEIAAAYAAGHLSRAEAITVAYCRGIAISTQTGSGCMMAVGLPVQALQVLITDKREHIKVAAVNSPSSTTLSGDTEHMDELYQRLQRSGTAAKFLRTGGYAYHSHHMLPIGGQYENKLFKAFQEQQEMRKGSTVTSKTPLKHWVSSVSPWESMSNKHATPQYWRKNLESAVLFSEAIEHLVTSVSTRVDILIEIGPHSALKGPVQQILTKLHQERAISPPTYLPTLRRHANGERDLLELCGILYCYGYPVNLIAANSSELSTHDSGAMKYQQGSICPDLPTYQYQYGPILSTETRISRDIRQRRFLRHDLLGVLQPGCSMDSPSWRNVLRVKDIPWLEHHKLIPHNVLPASGYVSMAVEAASQYSQLAPKTEKVQNQCFRLRNVKINSAMRIPESDTGLEVLFNLFPSPIAPNWYEFKISSVSDDGTWTDHASGIVSSSITVAGTMGSLKVGNNLRYIDTAPWYDKFQKAGLGYGPSFRDIWDLTSEPYRNIAQAKIGLQSTNGLFDAGPESEYAIHPSSLDMCHQVALIAGHGGQVDRFHHAFIPIAIDEMTVWPAHKDENWGSCIATAQMKGLRGIHATIQLFSHSGEPRVELNNLRCVAHHGGEPVDMQPSHEFTRLVWRPDLSSLSNEQANELFPPLAPGKDIKEAFENMDKLAALMILELYTRFSRHVSEEPVLRRFLQWVHETAASDIAAIQAARNLGLSERRKAIELICAELSSVVDVQFVKRIYDHIDAILHSRTTGVEVVIQDNLLSRVYTDGLAVSKSYVQLAHLMNLIGHRSPNAKILEVGAGTGAATQIALSVLSPKGSPKQYHSYTFSDVSTAFLDTARSNFSHVQSMDFKLFDFTKSPEIQEISAGFDLIIAAECLHTSRNIAQSLGYLRELLKPNGIMVLIETTKPLLGHNLSYGTFPNWWPEDESRNTPFLDTSEWNEKLRASGFSGIDLELPDYEGSLHVVSAILTTRREETNSNSDTETSEDVHFLYRKEYKDMYEEICARLRAMKLNPVPSILGEAKLPEKCRVILCLDEEEDNLGQIDEVEFLQIKAVIRHAASIFWLVFGDQLNGVSPRSAITFGLVRMLTTEMPETRHSVLSFDAKSYSCLRTSLVDHIVDRESRLYNGDLDRELALREGVIYISRLVFDQELNDRYRHLHESYEEPSLREVGHHGPILAAFSAPGLISSIYFRSDESAYDPLSGDSVEIKVAATGLNWKDVGVCSGRNDFNNFSQECSGTIVRCGGSVQDLRKGDRVYALAWGRFGNIARTPAKMVQKMRSQDRFEDMGGVPLVFCTAHYALNHLARLQPGERILIQGASGGVGLAAIQIARLKNAEIWCTVGNSEKAKFLIHEWGIPPQRVFSSRDMGDLQRMITATDSRGFNIILSSSSGTMMQESWRCIAPLGRFVDVGRLDVQNSAALGMEVFARNATFTSFDLSVVAGQSMETCARLMQEVGEMMRADRIRPVSPLKVFDVSELSSALLHLSQGKHLGKIVVTYTDDRSLVPMIPPKPSMRFKDSCLYILVGGLGGFGRGILQWMVSRGARNLALWSRSGQASPEGASLLHDLRSTGINVSLVACDITDSVSVSSAMTIANNQPYPVKGIINAAVTFCDQAFETLPYSQWKLGLSAKVIGTENLHRSSLGLDLDFFVMTSSYEAVVALPTQSAYCAANSFQDAFARYRRALGLPAAAIALGLITEIGEAGQRDITRLMIDRNNLYGTGEFRTLQLLESALLDPPTLDETSATFMHHWTRFDPLAAAQFTTCLEPVKLAAMLNKNGVERGIPRWTTDSKFAHIMQAVNDLMTDRDSHEPRSPQDTLANKLDISLGEGSVDSARGLLVETLKERLAGLLQMPVENIEEEKSVAAYGVDSLIAVELRNWLITSFQSTVPLLKILDERLSMIQLADDVIQERNVVKS